MKRLSSPWLLGLRDSQAWFILGVMIAGYAASSLLLYFDRERGMPVPEENPVSGFVGCFFLSFAAPYAAIRLIELERDGRFDQFRLTGRAPGQLLAAVSGSSAAPWLSAGLVFVIVAATLGELPSGWWRTAVPLILGSTTVSLLALALPAARRQSDLRLVTVAAGVFAAMLSMLSLQTAETLTVVAARFGVPVNAIVTMVCAIEIAVAAWCLRPAIAAIARPPTPRAATLEGRSWTASVPATIRRGVAVGAIPAAALTVFVLALIGVRAYARPGASPEIAIVIGMFPLLIGAVVVSTTSRADAAGSNLDLMRLSGTGSLISAIRIVGELWLPFLASAMIVVAATAVIGDVPRLNQVVALFLGALLVAPYAVLEGWYRGLLLTYVLPLTLLTAQWILRRPTNEPWFALFPYVLIAWIGWAFAAAILRHGIHAPFSLRLRIAAVAAITFVVGAGSSGYEMPSFVAFMLLLCAAWFEDRSSTWLEHWPLAAASIATSLVTLIYRGLAPGSALIYSVMPAVALMTGLQIHKRFGGTIAPWSVVIRLLTGMAVLVWDTIGFGWTVSIYGGTLRDPAVRTGIIQATTIGGTIVLIGIAGLIEVIHFAVRRSRRAVIPQP